MEEFNHFADIAAKLHQASAVVVKKIAFDLQARAQSLAPVDTGFLRSSIYTVTSDGSTYGQASGGTKESTLLPQVSGPSDDQSAFVGVGASYGIYVEMGTRRMPARPYFTPAVEQARAEISTVMEQIKEQLT